MGILSWFCNNLGLAHIELVKHILQYVSETLDLGLKCDREIDIPDGIVEYIDFNFAGSKKDKKFIRSYVFVLAKAAISHLFKLQS